ncbi:SDR family oxidoreductase [Cohnella nanjingensis]|uniref:SDR family oxidoreductase n=1 Tax=Cohnella nanjingensis TaxID=1387779 RepID=A0A7X0RSX3_9BACL|nr:SDR family oxidoreductase [Cohnella nanjingensis]MBB6673113.1 SDR family oxidoreductase [Cohnella nanjingensis]
MEMLKGKVALVTGASRGIGRGIALRLARDGAAVAVHYGSNKSAAEETVHAIREKGGTAFALAADLTAIGDIHAMFAALDAELEQRFGDNGFDILVNNAGIGQSLTIEETTEASLDEVMDIHVKAPIFVIQQALTRLRDGGRIVNLSSAVTRIAFPNLLGYSVSKGAVNTLTYVLAQQLGPRQITVNAIAPGFVETEMNADTLSDPNGRQFAAGLSTFGRWAQSSDVADIAAFLASADGRWVTGQVLDASGGSRL